MQMSSRQLDIQILLREAWSGAIQLEPSANDYIEGHESARGHLEKEWKTKRGDSMAELCISKLSPSTVELSSSTVVAGSSTVGAGWDRSSQELRLLALLRGCEHDSVNRNGLPLILWSILSLSNPLFSYEVAVIPSSH